MGAHVSTTERAEIRTAFLAKIASALPAAILASDPDPARLVRANPRAALFAQLVWRDTAASPSAPLAEVVQDKRHVWDVLLLIPTASPEANEALADEAFGALRAAIVPRAGWKPSASCGTVELVEEAFEGVAPIGRVYRATYAHDYWEG